MADRREIANEGLAAYVGITAPETPRFLLANNFLLEYFEPFGKAEQEYNYETCIAMETLYTEDEKNERQLRYSFDRFLRKYLGEDSIREGNSRLNRNRHYYFPVTQNMLASSTPTLRHMLFYLQNIGKNFDFKKTQALLEQYIFQDDTGINHIFRILFQNQEEKSRLKSGVDKKAVDSFWSMLESAERGRMVKLGGQLNGDLETLLTHRYFCGLDFYRRYNYLAVLLTSYVIQYIVCRAGSSACILCQGAPIDSRLNGAVHRASCNNYANIRKLFPKLLTNFYKDAITKNPENEILRIRASEQEIYINNKEFNAFFRENNLARKTNLHYEDIRKTFELGEGEERKLSVEELVMRYIDLTGSRRGSTLTKISSTLPTSGRQIDMIFPRNRSRQKYFAMSETLSEFYVRLYLARKNQKYDYLDNFIEDLQNRYRIVIKKSAEGEKMLRSMRITLNAQEYAKNQAAFTDMLNNINCLIKLSDSGYVVTLPEEKGAFKLI